MTLEQQPFEYVTRAAPPSLSDAVDSLWLARGTIGYGTERILPTPAPVLLLNLGSAFRVSSASEDHSTARRTAGWLVGPQTRYVRNEPLAETNVLGATLKPWGPGLLFGVSASEVRDRIVDLDLLWGPGLEMVRDRMASITSADARIDAFADELVREAAALTPHDVHEATGRLAVDGASVAVVARELGVSRRHLGRLFDRHVGLTPRTFSRVLRLVARSKPSAAGPACRSPNWR